ncbi:MAG: response regulator [Lentisphaerae bacterium]|nr:response regulator [Lentisphaerota bacterium]
MSADRDNGKWLASAFANAALGQAAVGILVADISGVIRYANHAAGQLYGCDPESLCGRGLGETVSGSVSTDSCRKALDSVRAGRPWRGRWVGARGDRQSFRCEAILSPLRDDASQIIGVLLMQTPVTADSDIAVRVREAGRMEAIGRFAEGVSSRLDGVIRHIQDSVASARGKLGEKDPLASEMDAALTEAGRAASFLKSLLLCGRCVELKPGVVDVQSMLDRIASRAREHGDSRLLVTLHCVDRPYGVYGDVQVIEDAVWGLCENAMESMREGGVLALEVGNALVDDAFVRLYPWAEKGDYVRISVKDTGRGIPREVMEHVFEPFFSTKVDSSAFGMGLPVAYAAVKRHSGMILIDNDDGDGTRVQLYLPRNTEVETKTKSSGNGKTVLVAEDEEMVRKIAVRVLENAGFGVLQARDGEEACDVFAANRDSVDLVLLDVQMPRKGGLEVYDCIRAARPDLPVLFSSGYGIGAVESGHRGIQANSMVQKPYTPSQLVAKVAEFLSVSVTG